MPRVTARRERPVWMPVASAFIRGRRLIAVFGALAALAGFAPAALGAQAEPAEPSSIEIAFERGRLTVDVRDAPLDEVLAAVGEEAGVAIQIRGDLTAPVTQSFADVPLDEGIRRLLRGHSYMLASNDAGQGRRLEISILTSHPVGTAASAASASAANDEQEKLQRVRALAGRKDPEAILELSRLAGGDPSAAVRAQAVAALGRLRTQDASAALTQALADPSASVRIQAMRGVKSLKGASAVGDLQAIAVNDPDVSVRRQAVRLMSDIRNPEVPLLLEQAAADSDPQVSQEAKRAAKRWEQRYGARYGAAGATR